MPLTLITSLNQLSYQKRYKKPQPSGVLPDGKEKDYICPVCKTHYKKRQVRCPFCHTNLKKES